MNQVFTAKIDLKESLEEIQQRVIDRVTENAKSDIEETCIKTMHYMFKEGDRNYSEHGICDFYRMKEVGARFKESVLLSASEEINFKIKSSVNDCVTEILSSEEFLDKLVQRIKSKQLG